MSLGDNPTVLKQYVVFFCLFFIFSPIEAFGGCISLSAHIVGYVAAFRWKYRVGARLIPLAKAQVRKAQQTLGTAQYSDC